MTSILHSRLMSGRTGGTFRVDHKLGGGGEGDVYALADRQELVVKLYTKPPGAGRVRKLEAMLAKADDPALSKIAAWPLDLVRDEQARVRGFVMPLAGSRKDIHELYSPKSREQAFPEADFRFLVHVAANIARAFATVHARDVVIGDINEKSVMAAPDGTVMLIDCDSFQIRAGSEVLTCDVGVPLYTPPELQGRPLRGQPRSVNHDLFGLAVLLFHLLAMGRHPFSGVYAGPEDMPIERAISEFRFAYGAQAAQRFRMRPPPGSVGLAELGREVATLFEQAFAQGAEQRGRPQATAWVAALERTRKELITCKADSSHHYPKDRPSCPWCQLEGVTQTRYFGAPMPATGQSQAVDIAALWRAILMVEAPKDIERPPIAVVPPPNRERQLAGRLLCGCAVVVGFALLGTPDAQIAGVLAMGGGVGLWPGAPWHGVERAQASLKEAETAIDAYLHRPEVRNYSEPFFAERRKLEQTRDRLRQMDQVRRQRLDAAKARARDTQLRRFLDRFRIDKADIEGVGPVKTRTLASFGIETAGDISRARVLRVQGFGPVLADRLVDWRRAQQKKFRFDEKAPLDPREVVAIERDIATERARLVAELRAGPRRLQTARAQAVARRRDIESELTRRVEVRDCLAAKIRT